jgi:hypothetical protein
MYFSSLNISRINTKKVNVNARFAIEWWLGLLRLKEIIVTLRIESLAISAMSQMGILSTSY